MYLIDDLLDVYQIKNGKFKKNESLFDIRASLTIVKDMFNVNAADKGLDLYFNYSSNVPTQIFTDEQRMRQVLMNLL